MFRILFIFFISTISMLQLMAQDDDGCNKLGVWLWRFEQTGQPSHDNLARTISSMGGKRIYVKVADGSYSPTSWPTILDKDLIASYEKENVEPWAWSYNYQGNVEAQARALYEAAKTGYHGFVVDIEIEFNGEDETLEALMQAFFAERERAIADGYASADFPFYVTTWGNPATHNFRIDIINDYVDGFMPQTYVEEWAGAHLTAVEACIQEGNAEYASLGATKPLHHIVSTAQEKLSAEEITEFFRIAGPETSLWRVPGGGVSTLIWDRWRDVDWDINFCQPVSTRSPDLPSIKIYPNPANQYIEIELSEANNRGQVEIYQQQGGLVAQQVFDATPIDISSLPAGMYHLVFIHDQGNVHRRFIKI